MPQFGISIFGPSKARTPRVGQAVSDPFLAFVPFRTPCGYGSEKPCCGWPAVARGCLSPGHTNGGNI